MVDNIIWLIETKNVFLFLFFDFRDNIKKEVGYKLLKIKS